MSLNRVMLIGNVGADPEIRYVDNNVPVANLRLATTDPSYTLQNGTVVPERTEWHNIVFWRQQAALVERFVKKGHKIYVEGQLRTRSFEDKSGIKHYRTEIFADKVEIFDFSAGQLNQPLMQNDMDKDLKL